MKVPRFPSLILCLLLCSVSGLAASLAASGELIFKRHFSQRATTIPAAQYEVVRSFFERIRAAEQSPVVLARK